MDLECYRKPGCRGSGPSNLSPSSSGRFKINPSSVPTDKGVGIEGIFFKDQVDVGIVRGTGRIGAAISPSNNEETIFGAPGIEFPSSLLERKTEKTKFPNQKYTFATAINLAEKKSTALRSYSVNLGVMAKHNRVSEGTNPGGGISGVVGPFSFGYSYYQDETVLDYSDFAGTEDQTIRYQVETITGGLYLSSLILDYSYLKMTSPEVSTVRLLTATLNFRKWILTAAERTEDSSKPSYNYDTGMLEYKQNKHDFFGGVQYSISKNVIVGVLYNYYLLHEFSFSTTIFF